MFKIDKTDLSIHVTRGDSLFFGVKAKNESGEFYRFIFGDLLRIKVYKKKNCSDVVIEKEFPVTIEGEEQQIYLSGTETKIGDVISKPTDYWYEVELNPYTAPQTVIGYDEDGARLFRLYPEGADKDGESISSEAQPPEKLEVLTGAVVNPEVIRGMSAYEIAVMHGFNGTEEEWLESLTEQTKANAAEVIAEADKQIGLMNEAGEAGKNKVKSAEDAAVAHIAGLAEGAYDIVQTTGDSETQVMSQGATTRELNQLSEEIEDLYISTGGDSAIDFFPYGTENVGYVQPNGNIGGNTSWKYYEFDVSAGDEFIVYTYCIVNVAPAIVFFNGTTVDSALPNEGEGGLVNIRFTVPNNVNKMKMNVNPDTTPGTIQKVISNKIPKADIYNVLYGKSLICLGDSITFGEGISDKTKVWGNLIAKRNSMQFTNAGISGSTMGEAVDGSNTNASYKTNRHLAIEGKDYALIWFGWNDHNFCSLGTFDGTDTTKTLVAYRKTLEYIIENFVETKVGVIIPYLWDYNQNPQDHSILDMINGIKAVCDLCGVPYLDLPKYNFLPCWGSDYPNNDQYYIKWNQRQQVFTTDTLHPNEKGNEYLSTIIENFLRSL